MKIAEKKLTFWEKVKRGHYLFFSYYACYTMYMDWKIAGRSLRGLVCNDGEEIYPVQSITYRVLHCAAPEIHLENDDIFVDIGCGWGRLLGYLINKGICKGEAYGVDINRQAVEFTKGVFLKNPGVHIIYGDAAQIAIPNATVYFLYNPFGENVMGGFLDRIEKTCCHNVRVYYLHPVYAHVFREREPLWHLKKKILLRPRHHIPLLLCEYEFNRNCENREP